MYLITIVFTLYLLHCLKPNHFFLAHLLLTFRSRPKPFSSYPPFILAYKSSNLSRNKILKTNWLDADTGTPEIFFPPATAELIGKLASAKEALK